LLRKFITKGTTRTRVTLLSRHFRILAEEKPKWALRVLLPLPRHPPCTRKAERHVCGRVSVHAAKNPESIAARDGVKTILKYLIYIN
jgi:hypothetical protein